MTSSMRPGVSASYTLTPASHSTNKNGVGIIINSPNKNDELICISSLADLTAYTSQLNDSVIDILTTIYDITSINIYLAYAQNDNDENFSAALDKLISHENIYLILPIDEGLNRINIIKTALEASTQNKREKLAIFTCPQNIDVLDFSNELNHERILLSYPQIYRQNKSTDISSAILAGLILKNDDPSSNLNSEHVGGDFSVSVNMSEEEINTAIASGICVFEKTGEYTELIRGVTTKTTDEAGNHNATYRNLSTIMLIDTVVPMIRNTVEQRLKFLVNSKASIDSLSAQIVILLNELVEDGILSTFNTPILTISTEDPSVLLISLTFTVSQGINKVAITCHITV